MIANMGFAALFGEADLFLALSQSGEFCVGERAIASRTRDAVFIVRIGAVFSADWMATGMAQLIVADLEAMADTDALVKDETFAFPQAFITRHRFEIFQDPTLQVKHVLDAE